MSSPGPSPRSSTSKTNPKQHHDFSTWPPKPTTSTEANARRSTLKDIFPGATSRVGGPCESRKEVRMLALGMGVLPDPYASEDDDEGGIEGFVIVGGGGSEDEDGGYRRTCMEVECSWEKEREVRGCVLSMIRFVIKSKRGACSKRHSLCSRGRLTSPPILRTSAASQVRSRSSRSATHLSGLGDRRKRG